MRLPSPECQITSSTQGNVLRQDGYHARQDSCLNSQLSILYGTVSVARCNSKEVSEPRRSPDFRAFRAGARGARSRIHTREIYIAEHNAIHRFDTFKGVF